MPHALTAHDRTRDLDTTLFTHDALIAYTAILTTVTFEILLWSEDALVEESSALTALGTIVDRLWLGDLTMGPFLDLLRRSKADADGVEIC